MRRQFPLFLSRLITRGSTAALTGGLTLSACTVVGPQFKPPPVELQAHWAQATRFHLSAGATDEQQFWASFQDPVLLDLLQQAQVQSPTLLIAAAQVAQAETVLRSTVASSSPSVQLAGGSNYSQPDLASKVKGKNEGSTTYQLLGQVSWELDFWGRQHRTVESKVAELESSRAAERAASVSLRASVASTYCNVRLYEQRIAVAQASLRQQGESLRIAEARYRLGAASELDYRQSQTQYSQAQAQLPALRHALATYQHALSVLLGETPDRFVSDYPNARALPSSPMPAAVGAPKDLLRRRPDVLQAEFNAVAQSARIGQAEAALYPTFTLSGSFGYSVTDRIGDLFRWDSRSLSGGLGLVLPLYDRDGLKAQVKVQDSLFRQAVLAYQNQVLKAQQEVEDALSAIAAYTAQVGDLAKAESAASRSAQLAGILYRYGQVDYTSIASAEQSLLQAADLLVQAQGALLQAHISAWRALGGLGPDKLDKVAEL